LAAAEAATLAAGLAEADAAALAAGLADAATLAAGLADAGATEAAGVDAGAALPPHAASKRQAPVITVSLVFMMPSLIPQRANDAC